jgi:NAD(P)H-quinone oxidoreductase subunit 5
VTAALTVPLTLAATTAVADAAGAHHGGLGPLSFLLGLALAPMLARAAAGGVHTLVDAVGDAAGIVGLYLLWHIGFDLLSLGPAPGAFVTTVGWALVVPAFVALFIVQVLLAAYPQGRMARTLQPHLFAGFYLDALFTRMTFVVWPPRIPPRPPLQLPELTPETQVS